MALHTPELINCSLEPAKVIVSLGLSDLPFQVPADDITARLVLAGPAFA
jgi:hypothetical protein